MIADRSPEKVTFPGLLIQATTALPLPGRILCMKASASASETFAANMAPRSLLFLSS
ncbi:MAG: hypothetical protein Q9181_008267, partial [Wetmoreana brouardii]